MSERTLAGRTIVMSGGSRGIGLAIALRAARDGANVVILAKTARPDPRLHGDIHSASAAIEEAGGRALGVVGDVRVDADIERAVAAAVETFGGVDVCINNASALNLSPTLELEPKSYDLMQDINVRGTFMLTRACIPHLRRSDNPHVLTLSPPLNLAEHWIGRYPGYMLSKYGMTLAALGFAAEFRADGIASNALWPRTTVATDAVRNNLGGDAALQHARWPAIMADAAHRVLTSPSREYSGNAVIDDDVLREAGVADFGQYAVSGRDEGLEGDFFLD